MPFYMFQGRYTSAAFKAMVDTPQDREAPARELVEAFGGMLHLIFFCMGTDDIVALIEAPGDDAMASGAMVLAASCAFAGVHTTKLLSTAEAMNAMKKPPARPGQGPFRGGCGFRPARLAGTTR